MDATKGRDFVIGILNDYVMNIHPYEYCCEEAIGEANTVPPIYNYTSQEKW